MIEKIVKDYLKRKLDIPVLMEKPKNKVDEYVLIDKTGSSRKNQINSATFVLQSSAKTLENAAILNEKVKAAMDEMPMECDVFSAKLNTDYSFTDSEKKEYRYQAVYDITF